jgi:hypothetical protein
MGRKGKQQKMQIQNVTTDAHTTVDGVIGGSRGRGIGGGERIWRKSMKNERR